MSAFDAELERLLQPQERVDAIFASARPRAGRHVVDLAYANPYDGVSPAVMAALHGALEAAHPLDLQYAPYGGLTTTRRLVADRERRLTGEAFEWQDVFMTPGGMAGLATVFRSLRAGASRDEVIVPVPCWLDGPLYLAQLGITPVLVPLAASTFRLDLAAIESALTPATRGLVLSQPANPSGVVYELHEIEALGQLLQAHRRNTGQRVLLVTDECHRDLVFPGSHMVFPAAAYDDVAVVYSFGKSLLLQGQRIGYAAIGPRSPRRLELRESFGRAIRVLAFCGPTSHMQLAVRRLLAVTADVPTFDRRARHVRRVLSDAGYEVVAGQGTYFVYFRSPVPDDFDFVATLAEQGVLALPSQVFHHRGYVRLSLTATDEMIARGLDVLCQLAPAAER